MLIFLGAITSSYFFHATHEILHVLFSPASPRTPNVDVKDSLNCASLHLHGLPTYLCKGIRIQNRIEMLRTVHETEDPVTIVVTINWRKIK